MEENKELQKNNLTPENNSAEEVNAQCEEQSSENNDQSNDPNLESTIINEEEKGDEIKVISESIEEPKIIEEPKVKEETIVETTVVTETAKETLANDENLDEGSKVDKDTIDNETNSDKTEDSEVSEDLTIEDENIYGEDKDEKTDEEEEHDDHEDVEVTEEMFHPMSREELLKELEEVVKVENVNKYKRKISYIRLAFIQKTKEKKQEEHDQFVEKNGEEANYIEQKDEIEIKFNEVMSVYRQKRAEYNRKQEEQKQYNLKKKQEILEKLRELINSEEPLKKTYDEFKVLQDEWKDSGLVPRGEVVELWKNYHFLVEKFFDKVKINKELRDLGLKKNLKKKIELCEKAEDLIVETNILKSFKLLQKYHEKWREIGPVPHENNEEIWQRFKSATDKINDRRREYYNERDEIYEENYKIKQALCVEAQEVIDNLNQKEDIKFKDWMETSDKINEIFERWKKTGRAKRELNDEIWNKFKSILDVFFKQKKAYFKEMKNEQKENYDKKLELVLRAESIKDNDDWKETKSELINLQRKWKEIGHVPRKHSDKLWKRFRGACDHFFDRRNEFFKDQREEEKDNLAKKQALLETIKEFKISDDKTQDIEKLKAFQRDWISIGFVPLSEKDKINKSFKKLIDKHFEDLNISALEQKAMRYKNRVENLKDEPNSNSKINRERNFLSGKVKDIKEEIQLLENNIGFFAHSKKSEQLKIEFQKKIDRAKQELTLLKSKIRLLDSAESED